MTDNVYEQLINDYIEIQSSKTISSFIFGRIMNFIFMRLKDDEKDVYLEIRKKISIERLERLLSRDWINSNHKISDRLIELARHWKKFSAEKVTFT